LKANDQLETKKEKTDETSAKARETGSNGPYMVKGKAIPLQALTGPKIYQEVEAPRF
jgi:hypothetical protein